MQLGVIDVGSNTVHLQVIDAHHGVAPTSKISFKHQLKLIEYLDKDNSISQEGIAKLIEVIKDLLTKIETLDYTEVLAFATSAIREATNSEDVLNQVNESTGIDLDVLSGSDEARFTFLAGRRWIGWSAGKLTVIDIGGGSVEIATGVEEVPLKAFSLPLGSARLTRDFSLKNPVSDMKLKKLEDYLENNVEAIIENIGDVSSDYVLGTSKTFRTLMRIQKNYLPKYGESLNKDALAIMVNMLKDMDEQEILKINGISSSRAKQITAGAVTALALMRILRLESINICPWALREGIVLRRLDWLRQ